MAFFQTCARHAVCKQFIIFVYQNPNAHPRPIPQDLAGFWDMLQLSIENISLKFDELHQLKANNWKPLTPLEFQVQTHFQISHLFHFI